ncbi:hypothetical protein GTCCBUS3UF5_38020 [Geobacillus thermoleovorans CCB_US3_UF5]|uniref:Uncharacterized protein n=1 Tax=Geobacillus thermoleovorans CCB_US3_UF5 TaxID=1111068 RepID=A0ABM5MMI6_GEOTH|nr:hypothetical protein GTCCBUS3UF5_38020 [Geobacillus thermoleovorans CCB_US3_UF5]
MTGSTGAKSIYVISIPTCRQNGNISTLYSPKDDSVINVHRCAFFAKGKPLVDGAV